MSGQKIIILTWIWLLAEGLGNFGTLNGILDLKNFTL